VECEAKSVQRQLLQAQVDAQIASLEAQIAQLKEEGAGDRVKTADGKLHTLLHCP